MFSARELNFGGLLLEPNIVYFKDFRQEFIKFIIKEENSDIIRMIPDDILSLCDLKFFKYQNSLSITEKYNEHLINLLVNFLNENTIILGRFPSYLSRYINNYYQTISKKVPSFCDVIKSESGSIDKNNESFSKVIEKKKDCKKNKTTNCIMLRNIGKDIGYNELKSLLNEKKIYPVNNKNNKAIHFPYDKKTNIRMNYAFLTFNSIDESINAKKILNGLSWNNCVFNVLDAKGN